MRGREYTNNTLYIFIKNGFRNEYSYFYLSQYLTVIFEKGFIPYNTAETFRRPPDYLVFKRLAAILLNSYD